MEQQLLQKRAKRQTHLSNTQTRAGRKNNLFGASLSQAYWGASLLLSCLVYSPWCHSRSVFSPKKEVPGQKLYHRRFYMDCLSSLCIWHWVCSCSQTSDLMHSTGYQPMSYLPSCSFRSWSSPRLPFSVRSTLPYPVPLLIR